MAAAAEWPDALVKDVARCAKKHKAASASALDSVDKMLQAVAQARDGVAARQPDAVATLRARLAHVGEEAASSAGEAAKGLTAVVGKLGKTVEKHFTCDVARAWWNRPFDDATLQQVIAQHLYREGRFDVGDLYSSETGAAVPQELKAPFTQLHIIVAALRSHNVAPALAWVGQHRQELARAAASGADSTLEWQLHRLHFLTLLKQAGRAAAVQYARANFGAFNATQSDDVQRLMGCLLFADRLEESPYAHVMSERMWGAAASTFTRDCCALMGAAGDSPFAVVVDAGAAALPTLMKMTNVMAAKGQPWESLTQLPLEVELPPRFTFHSVFACPVARDQSSPDNPPMILPCGLVLCKQSIQKLARGNGRVFKCPYCPIEVGVSQCKQIYF